MMIFNFILLEFFFLLILTKVRNKFFYTFAAISYDVFFVGFYSMYKFNLLPLETMYNNFLFIENFAERAIYEFIKFKISFNFIYLFLRFSKIIKFNNNFPLLQKSNLKNNSSFKFFLFFMIIITLSIQIFGGLGIDNFFSMLFEGKRFLIKNKTLANSTYSMLLLIFFIVFLLWQQKKVGNFILSLSFIGAIFVPIINSSRATAIPFGFICAFYFLHKKYYKSILFAVISLLGYLFGIINRGLNSWKDTLIALFSYNIFNVVKDFFLLTSNFPTLTTTLYGIQVGYIILENPILNFFKFILHLLPIPASLLPFDYRLFASLTPHFDFPLGITTDIISESIILFGTTIGPIFIGTIVGFLTLIMDKLEIKNYFLNFILKISFLYFLISSNIYSFRHSSRLFVYCIVFYFAIKFMYKYLKIFTYTLKRHQLLRVKQ